MTDEQIYEKIENIYNSKKGHNFIVHLLRSFFPVHKSTFLWDTPDGVELKCCITSEKLWSKFDAMNYVNSNLTGNMILDSVKADLNKLEKPESVKNFQQNMYKIAIACESSDKYLSPDAYEQLLQFYQNQLLMGNGKLNWVANNERAKEMVNQGKSDGYIETKREEKAVHKVVEHKKATLGDLKALQNLKKKFEEEENDI